MTWYFTTSGVVETLMIEVALIAVQTFEIAPETLSAAWAALVSKRTEINANERLGSLAQSLRVHASSAVRKSGRIAGGT